MDEVSEGDRIEVNAWGRWEPATVTSATALSDGSGVVVGFRADSGRGGAGIWGCGWMRALQTPCESCGGEVYSDPIANTHTISHAKRCPYRPPPRAIANTGNRG